MTYNNESSEWSKPCKHKQNLSVLITINIQFKYYSESSKYLDVLNRNIRRHYNSIKCIL